MNAFGEKINRRGGVSPPTNSRGRVYPCPDFRFNPETFQQSGEKFRQIAQDQAEYFIDAQKTLNMHRKLTEIQAVQQQATDMLRQKIQKTTQLAQLRGCVTQVKAVENTLARVQESETQLVQMDMRETRLLGLQKKTKEYHDNLRILGKKLSALPEPVQKEWKHLEAKAQAAGKDFITPEWKILKKDLQGKLDQEIGKLDTQKQILAQTYKNIEKIIPVGNGRDRSLPMMLENTQEWQSIQQDLQKTQHTLKGYIKQAEKELIQNPNTAIIAQWQSLQNDLTNQAEQFTQSEIQEIIGLQPKELSKQITSAQNHIQKELTNTLETIKQGVVSGKAGAQLQTLKDKQEMVWHTLESNIALMQQNLATDAVLQRFVRLDNAEIGLKNILDSYCRGALSAPVTQYNTQKAHEEKQITQAINEFKKISRNREKISTTLNMVSKSLAAQIRSTSLKINSAEMESIAAQAQSLFNMNVQEINVGAWHAVPKEIGSSLNNITRLAAGLTPDISGIMQDLDSAANMLEVNRRLSGIQEQLANAAQDILAGRAPPEWNAVIGSFVGADPLVLSEAEGRAVPLDAQSIVDNAISSSIDFIRQQAVRTQIQRSLNQVANLGNQAEALLNKHITDIQVQLAQYEFIDPFNVVGADPFVGPIMANLNLDEMAKQFSLNGAQQKIFSELQKLQNIQDQFAGGIQRQLLEIQRADAAVVMDLVAKKYQHLSQEFQQAWETFTYQVDPTHWSFDPAFNFADLGQFQLDQQLLQKIQQNIFSQLVQSNPALQEIEKLRDVTGLLNDLVAQGGSEFKTWLTNTQAFQHVERLSKLRVQAEDLINQALIVGARRAVPLQLKGDIAKLMQKIGLETQEVEAIFGAVTGPLQDIIMKSDFMQQLDLFKNLPNLINEEIDTLLGDLQSFIQTNSFIQSIDNLGKDLVRVMDQLSGKVPFNLSDLGNQIFQQFNITGKIGNSAVAQIQTLVAEMGITGNAMDLWSNISESLMNFGDNLVGGLRDFITAACSVDLGAIFCNLTSAATDLFSQAGNFVGGLFSNVFEFRFDNGLDISSVWDTVADIFNSENFRFDFYQAADGLMRSISDGLSNHLDSGLNWMNDRWNEYYGQAEEYWNIIAGGPERWIEELQSGKWDSTINSLIDRYLPPEYQPAKSALTKIATIFDKDFTLDADFVIGFLDDLSAYLSEDVKEYYEDLKDYYEQGKEIYETTETVVNAISSGNVGSLVTNIQKLFGGMDLQFGSVYTWGGGRANKQGGYNNVGANLAFALQEQLDEYLASLPPEIRAEVERNLCGDYDRYDVGANLVFAQNEIDIADYASGRQTAGAGSATGPDNAVGANLVFARQDMTPAQLSPPRMAGPPMPPGCYWDVETQAWVSYKNDEQIVGGGFPRPE
ncbi:hypothetical protein KAR34_08880 [bacterium]|nr:hypothetical protein [bacterium]